MKRVLYVDDDDALRELAELLLDAADIEMLAFQQGEDAVSAAPAFAPQLLLLDKEMPGMDGPQTLAALRGLPECADVPAVFMTADTAPERVAALLASGAIAVISKPIEPAQFVGQLQSAWEKAQTVS